MAPTTAPGLLERQVVRVPYTGPAEESILAAIDHRGRRVAEVVVPAGADVGEVAAILWVLLDEVDPVPSRLARPPLAIVRGAERPDAGALPTSTGRRRAPRLTLARGGARR